MGLALRGRRLAAGIVLCRRRRLGPQAKTKYNGEQQIYVDPGYEGRGMVPLARNPFKVRDGVLSIVASRIPSDLKEVLFSMNTYRAF